MMSESNKTAEFRQGVIVLVILAVLTAIEYGIAVTTQLWAALVVIGVIKAVLVIEYYMHLPRVMSGEGGH